MALDSQVITLDTDTRWKLKREFEGSICEAASIVADPKYRAQIERLYKRKLESGGNGHGHLAEDELFIHDAGVYGVYKKIDIAWGDYLKRIQANGRHPRESLSMSTKPLRDLANDLKYGKLRFLDQVLIESLQEFIRLQGTREIFVEYAQAFLMSWQVNAKQYQAHR